MSCNMQFSKKHTGSLDNLQKFGFSFFDDDVYVLTVSLYQVVTEKLLKSIRVVLS